MSDTESEPDNSLPKCTATEFAHISTQAHFHKPLEHGVNNVRQAVETLSSINIEGVKQGTSRHDDIQEASSIILSFINDFTSSDTFLDEAPQDVLSSFSHILNMSFVLLLLEYRVVFHSIAARQIPPGMAVSSVICWVDVILSQLASAVISGFSTSRQPEFPGLKKQREDDTLRAAAQLPYEWENVLGVISSDTASPAACRLALRLAFAVYVVGGKICRDENTSSKADSGQLRTVLDMYIHRISAPRLAHTSGTALPLGSESYFQVRLSRAMVLALLSEVELSPAQSIEAPIFRPHTSAILMHFIQHVIRPDENDFHSGASLPLVNLDLPQRLVVHWGKTTCWSWTNWDDERPVESDLLTLLTATWLYHIKHAENGPSWEDVIRSLLIKNANAASVATAMLLRRLMRNLTSYSSTDIDAPTVVVLYRSVWMVIQLLGNDLSVSISIELVRCLFGLFALAPGIEHEESVDDLVLHGLTLCIGEPFRSALLSIQEDTRVNFPMKIDLVVSNITRSFQDNQHGQRDLTKSTRQILMFLAVVWSSGSLGCFHQQAISSFLSSLVEQISSQEAPHSILRSSLLIALTCLENIKPPSSAIEKVWDDNSVWILAMNLDPTNLSTTSAFANYIISTAKNRKCDALCFADAWDHFRDCLLLILTHHFLGDEEPLALIVVESICRALTNLLRYGNSKARNFIISSPWTMSLCAGLQHAMEVVNQDDMYALLLKEKLSIHGLELKTRIARLVSPTISSDEVPLPTARWSTTLMFCWMESTGPFLLQVPQ